MKSKHVVVMTFPSWKWNEYGYCAKGFADNWPDSVQGYAIVEKPEELPADFIVPENLTILDFDEVCGERTRAFEERNRDKGIFDFGTTGNIAVQAAKFARKAIAQLYVLENIDADYIHYIDADLYTHKPFTLETINTLTSSDFLVACTPRWWKKKIPVPQAVQTKKLGEGYTETGYMIWNKKHPLFQKWINIYSSMYDKDEIFEYDAWHDCVSFDRATLTCILEDNVPIVDLGYGVRSSHPLVSGPLGKYMDHMKGNRKFVGESKERIRVHGK